MKKITLPNVTFTALAPDGSTVEEISPAQQLYRIVAYPPPQKGLSIDDIRLRLPLADKLAKANRTVLLEDGEYTVLMEAMREASWRGVSRDVVALADALAEAETIDVEAKRNRAQRRRSAKN